MSSTVIMSAAHRPQSSVDPGDKGPPSPIKQPLKRVQIPLIKFNDVAIPHHVDLLKRHKSNIEKFQIQEEWERVHREQINATRTVKQLKALLYEMDMLRNQVQDSDVTKFDKLTAVARQNAHDTITEYLNLSHSRPTSPNSFENLTAIDDEMEDEDKVEENDRTKLETQKLKAQIHITSEELEKQQQCLNSWEHLQTEVRDINELFKDFSKIVHEHQESVDYIETTVETAAENVAEGASHLKHVKAALYPLAGAVIGGCIGGPVGLIAGMKMGGLAAVGCGFIGFTGGKFLKKKKEEELNELGVELMNIEKNRLMKGSTSLPEIRTSEELSPGTVANKSHVDVL